MAKKWQIVFSVVLAFAIFFPNSAWSATKRHQVSTKKTSHHSVKRTTKAKTKRKHTAAAKSARSIATRKSTKTKVRTKLVYRRPLIASRNMWYAPMATKPFNAAISDRVKNSFQSGLAGRYSSQDLVRARVFNYYPLRGGIRQRNALVSSLIIHSTETASPADAKTVIKSWNHGGLSHPGTQYIVDRDGKIFCTVDPKYATIHVNERRTLGGVTNDNSIGIEIVRTGKQKYTKPQLASLVRLVDYIQDRYPTIAHIYGHGQIQPSTRTDPVAFNWSLFSQQLALINSASTQTAYNNRASTQTAYNNRPENQNHG